MMTEQTNENSSTLARVLNFLATLDRRWIFLLMAGITIIFMVMNARISIPISAPAQGVYNAIEALQPGDRVHLSIDYGPSSQAELLPMHITMLRQLFRKKAVVVCSSLWTDSPPMTEKVWEIVAPEFEKIGEKKVYGVDFVNLGFKAGDRTAIASIGNSFKNTFPIDYRGNKTSELPIMQGWDDYSGIALLCTLAVGDPGPVEYIQQAQSRYNIKMITGCTALLSPQLYPFFQSNNLLGFLGGLAGAAEYETLNGESGQGIKGMNVQSAIHMLIVLLVLLGNIAAFLLKFVPDAKPGAPNDPENSKSAEKG